MVDARYLERSGNVVVEDDSGTVQLKAWAAAVHAGGSRLWAQISHPGRQCPRLVNATPLAPSAVQLHMAGNFGRPRAATEADIQDIIAALRAHGRRAEGGRLRWRAGARRPRLPAVAVSCRRAPTCAPTAGAARWPTAPALLLEVLRAVRAPWGPASPISVKLNSSDFVKGGFTLDESRSRWCAG